MNEGKEQYWSRHLEKQNRSGESQERYCQREKISSSSFVYWKKRLSTPKSVRGAEFVRVDEQALIKILLSNGVELRVPEASLQAVLGALNA